MLDRTPHAAADALSRLTHHRWALPVLAMVTRDRGCKFVTLSRRLGVSPTSLRRALDRLAELDLVVRNPGYGHPMRPEYVLGPLGTRAAGLPEAIVDWAERDGLAGEVLKKWPLPLLVALGDEPRRFSEIRTSLVHASPRAVALALKGQASVGLVSRVVDDGYPPVPLYAPTKLALAGREPAHELGKILASG